MAYRDDENALQEKKADIEARLSHIEAQRRELADLSKEEADLGRELVDVQRRLDEKRRLPLLSRVEVAAPCPADWDVMVGDDRARFCSSCEKHVYNLSALTTQEAEQLIREKEGDLCVRYFQRKDGTVMTADCPVGVRRRRVRRFVSLVAVGAGAVAAGASFGMGAERTMGAMRVMPAPPRIDTAPQHELMGVVTPEQFLLREEAASREAEAKAAARKKATEEP